MNKKYLPLFQPFILNNGVSIKNRLVVAPMTHYSSNDDGSISSEERAFLQRRATDFGLFICAATLVSPEGKAFEGQPEAVGEKDLASLSEVANLIKQQGAKAILQIHHGGKLSDPSLLNNADLVAPSADEKTNARALSENEILKLINAFANATELAMRAGFDGVEIHGANGFLIQQFYSAQSNHRQDYWGGDAEKRLHFPLAVVDAVTAVKTKYHRNDFIIGYRFSPEEPGENGLTIQDTFRLIDELVKKPLQYLHVSLWDFYKKARRGADTSLTRMQLLHQHINGRLPLIGVGNLFTADQILAAFETRWAEFIAIGKTVMINPNIATLIATGKEADICTTIDPQKNDYYLIPNRLWEKNMQGLAYLPPLKEDKNWSPIDV